MIEEYVTIWSHVKESDFPDVRYHHDPTLTANCSQKEKQRVACPFVDFEEGVEEFLATFRARLVHEAHAVGEAWWQTNVERGSALRQGEFLAPR
jgi:hypothetical protein